MDNELKELLDEFLATKQQIKNLKELAADQEQNIISLFPKFKVDYSPTLRVYADNKKVKRVDFDSVCDFFSIDNEVRSYLTSQPWKPGAIGKNEGIKDAVTVEIKDEIKIKEINPEMIQKVKGKNESL